MEPNKDPPLGEELEDPGYGGEEPPIWNPINHIRDPESSLDSFLLSPPSPPVDPPGPSAEPGSGVPRKILRGDPLMGNSFVRSKDVQSRMDPSSSNLHLPEASPGPSTSYLRSESDELPRSLEEPMGAVSGGKSKRWRVPGNPLHSKVDEVPPIPPASPFSQLFPEKLLSESGLLILPSTSSALSVRKEEPNNSHPLPPAFPILSNPGSRSKSFKSQSKSPLSVSCSTFQCQQCEFKATTSTELESHRRHRHPAQKIHSCNQCETKFTRRSSLNAHIRRKHPVTLPKYCPIQGCSFVTRNPNSFQIHRKNHQTQSSVTAYFCKGCPHVRYTQRRSLLKHITEAHASDVSLIGMAPDHSQFPKAAPQKEEDIHSRKTSQPDKIVATESSNNAILPETSGGKRASDAHRREEPGALLLPESYPSSSSSSCRSNSLPSSPLGSKPGPSPEGSGSEKKTRGSGKKTAVELDDSKSCYACDRCTYSTRTFAALYAHRKREHIDSDGRSWARGTKLGTCMYCWKKFPGPDRLMAHIKSHHIAPKAKAAKARRANRKNFSCSKCEFTTSTKRVFTAHGKMHERDEDRNRRETSPAVVLPSCAGHLTPPRRQTSVSSSGGKRKMSVHSSGKKKRRNSTSRPPSSSRAPSPSSLPSSSHSFSVAASRSGGPQMIKIKPMVVTQTIPTASRSLDDVPSTSQGITSSRTSSDLPIHATASNPPIVSAVPDREEGSSELVSCILHLQQANSSLLQLLQKREGEKSALKDALLRLLQAVDPNGLQSTIFNSVMSGNEGALDLERSLVALVDRVLE